MIRYSEHSRVAHVAIARIDHGCKGSDDGKIDIHWYFGIAHLFNG